MKKAIVSIICIAVVVFTILSVAYCNQQVKFSRGTIDQDIYTSKFSGITFKKPSEWKFYSDDEISQLLNSTSAQIGSEEFDNATEGSIFDFMATSNEGNSVSLEIRKVGLFADVDGSVQESVRLMKELSEDLGYTFTASDPIDKKLGDATYRMVTIQLNAGAVNLTQYVYFRKVGNYLLAISCTAARYITQSQFEAMFS